MAKITDFRSITADKPGELISVDIWGPLPSSRAGIKHVLVMLDICSKYVKLFEMKKATTNAVLAAYEKYIQMEGKPDKILSNLGTQFSSNVYKRKLTELGIKFVYTSVRHTTANPVERVMREIGRLGRIYCGQKHKSWCHHLRTFEKWMNEVTHESTGLSPSTFRGPQTRTFMGKSFPVILF